MTDYKIKKAIRNGQEYEIGGTSVDGHYVDFVVVGGGGGGGFSGGGGGGGQVKESIGAKLNATSYTVTVGDRGLGCQSSIGYSGAKGGDSCFAGTVAYGGGGGSGGATSCCAIPGGNGGGGYYPTNTSCMLCGYTKAGQYCSDGNPGMYGVYVCGCALLTGGGGGAGGAAYNICTGDGVCCKRPDGGKGKYSIVGGTYYGGGGGGSSGGAQGWEGCGGCGGGGKGKSSATYYGGGGGSYCHGYQGIVIIRYKTDGSCGINCATGGTVTTSGNYTLHTFTSNGTFCIVS